MCQLLLVTSEVITQSPEVGYTYSLPENVVESSPKCTESVGFVPASPGVYVKFVMRAWAGVGHKTPLFVAPPPAPVPVVPAVPVPAPPAPVVPEPPVPVAPPVPLGVAAGLVQAMSPQLAKRMAKRFSIRRFVLMKIV